MILITLKSKILSAIDRLMATPLTLVGCTVCMTILLALNMITVIAPSTAPFVARLAVPCRDPFIAPSTTLSSAPSIHSAISIASSSASTTAPSTALSTAPSRAPSTAPCSAPSTDLSIAPS